MTLTLAGKLLLAARYAYEIDQPPFSVPPIADWQKAVGFSDDPVAFAAGDSLRDAALVGKTDYGTILAFRGTEPPSDPNHIQCLRDWLNDADAQYQTAPWLDGANVHQGFLRSLIALWPTLLGCLKDSSTQDKPLYIVGHSKGGSLANLAASKLANSPEPGMRFSKLVVCTFAAARPGDQAIAADYQSKVPYSTRYEYGDDVVPHLMPSGHFLQICDQIPAIGELAQELPQGYASVGELHYIDKSGQFVSDSPIMEIKRVAALVEQMMQFKFDVIAKDHSIDKNSGYAQALCPGI